MSAATGLGLLAVAALAGWPLGVWIGRAINRLSGDERE